MSYFKMVSALVLATSLSGCAQFKNLQQSFSKPTFSSQKPMSVSPVNMSSSSSSDSLEENASNTAVDEIKKDNPALMNDQNTYSYRDVGHHIPMEYGTVVKVRDVNIFIPEPTKSANDDKDNKQSAGASLLRGVEYTIVTRNRIVVMVQYKNDSDRNYRVGSHVLVQTTGNYQRILNANGLPKIVKRPQGIRFDDVDAPVDEPVALIKKHKSASAKQKSYEAPEIKEPSIMDKPAPAAEPSVTPPATSGSLAPAPAAGADVHVVSPASGTVVPLQDAPKDAAPKEEPKN